MNIANLFPTPIGHTTLDKPLTKKEVDFIVNQPRRANLGNSYSMNTYLLDTPELAKLKKKLLGAVKEYFNAVYKPDPDKLDIYITQSWANYTEPGQSHHEHTHANSLISGVLYIQTENELDKIHFYKERMQKLQIVPTEWNEWNAKSWWLPADKHSLLLFPSDLGHSVKSVECKHTRISLAFNTFVKGSLGGNEGLTELFL